MTLYDQYKVCVFSFACLRLHLALWVELSCHWKWCKRMIHVHCMLIVSQEWSVTRVSIRTWKNWMMGRLLCIVTRFWTGQLRNGGSILGRVKRYFSSLQYPGWLWGPSNHISHMYLGEKLFLGSKAVKAWNWPLPSPHYSG